MTDCLCEAQLDALLSGALDDDVAARVDAHLASCAACAAALARREAAGDTLFDAVRAAVAEPLDSTRTQSDAPAEVGPPRVAGYEITAELGRGGQGAVYRAVQTSTQRTVALKVLLTGAGASLREQVRFEREVELAARLDHPGIVTVYDGGVSDGRHYCAMALIDGQPLNRWATRRAATLRERVALLARVAGAIGYAHQKGVIHRDLKPANILVDDADGPHVLDFGLAKPTDDALGLAETLTAGGEFLGTLAYAAPEQTTGDPRRIDVRTDVYALGVVGYELLTGQLPVDVRGGLADVLERIVSSVPPAPSSLAAGIDFDLETILLMALAKEPARRYASAADLAADLARYQRGEPIDARRDSPWYVLRLALRRHRGWVVAGLGSAALLVVGLLAVTRAWRVAADQRDIARDAERVARRARAREAEQRGRAERAARAAERAAYLASIAAAAAALREHDVVDATLRLERAPERLRGWEWRHLRARLDGSRRRLLDGAGYLKALAWAADGRLAVGGWSRRTWVWSRSLRRVTEQRWPHPVHALAFAPDGRLAVGLFDGSIRLWRPGMPPESLAGPVSRVSDLAWRPDGRVLAASYIDGPVLLWDVDRRLAWPLTLAPEHADELAWHPDGRRLAIAGAGVRIVDAETGAVERVLAPPGRRRSALAFDATGARLAAGDRDEIAVWRVADGARLHTLRGHTGRVHRLAFSGDGRELASASLDKTVRRWDLRDGRARRVHLGHRWVVEALAYRPGSNDLASAAWDGSVRLWAPGHAPARRRLRGHRAPVLSLAYAADGRLASGSVDTTVRVWPADGGDAVVLRGHTRPVQSVAWRPDGRRLGSASWDGSARVWDLEGRPVAQRLELAGARMHALAWSADGETLATGTAGNRLTLWDVATGRPLRELSGHDDHIHAVRWSPTGDLLASAGHRSIRLWTAAGQPAGVLARQILQEDYSLAFDPSGRRLAAGIDLTTIAVWDVRQRRVIRRWRGHTGEIVAVAWSPDGTRLVSAARDGTVRLWRADDDEPLLVLSGERRVVKTVAWGPGGRVAAGFGDGSIDVWREHPDHGR